MSTNTLNSRVRKLVLGAFVALAIAVLSGCNSSSMVTIRTGDNAQQVVNAHPEGTTFVFEAGTHNGVNIIPKNNQSFLGDGAVLNGQGSTEPAFAAWNGVKNVAILGLEITNYRPGAYTGVIDARSQSWTDNKWNAASNWFISGVHVHHNGGAGESTGVNTGSGTRVQNSVIEHNNGTGLYGNGERISIVKNVVSNNAKGVTTDQEVLWHSGGMKLVIAHDSKVEGNTVFANRGPGIWFDVNSDNNVIRNNNIFDNTLAGIHYEISRSAVIEGNVVRNNGHGDNRGWMHPAAISISSSHNVKVRSNRLRGNAGGIGVFDQRTLRNNEAGGQSSTPQFGRLYDPNGSLAVWRAENVQVTGNQVHNSGISGASATDWESYGSNVYETTTFANNTFTGSTTLYWGSGTGFASPVSNTAWTQAHS